MAEQVWHALRVASQRQQLTPGGGSGTNPTTVVEVVDVPEVVDAGDPAEHGGARRTTWGRWWTGRRRGGGQHAGVVDAGDHDDVGAGSVSTCSRRGSGSR